MTAKTALESLAARIRGRVRYGEPLAGYTTYRIGGPATALVMPANPGDVASAILCAREAKLSWLALGLGSNLLIDDGGFDGVVIRLGKGLDWIEYEVGGDRSLWRVGAGLPTPLLARRSADAGLSGAHRLVGVPGTVGGGVFMNAGAHGQDFATIVRRVEVVDTDGQRAELDTTEIPWRYRSSGLEDRVILGATLALVPDDSAALRRELRHHLRKRREGTPFNEPCCGSVFRNPSTGTAGQLIDRLGLKGFKIGGAQVSPMHANYIVNVGGATARDVQAVIDAVRERVSVEFGVELELEVKIV